MFQALHIRLSRCGSKSKQLYRVEVVQSQSNKDGKFIERVGTFDPNSPEHISIDLKRYKHWMANGAIPSTTITRAIARSGMDLANL